MNCSASNDAAHEDAGNNTVARHGECLLEGDESREEQVRQQVRAEETGREQRGDENEGEQW